MAEVVQISGTTSEAKIRNPLAVVLLSFITFGIYFWFWWYFVNREMAEYGEANGTDECGDSPGMSLLAVTLGAFIIVPPFVSIFKGFNRMNAANRLAGSGEKMEAAIGLIVWIFIAPVGIFFFQYYLNKAWHAMAGGGTAPAVEAAVAETVAVEAESAADAPADNQG